MLKATPQGRRLGYHAREQVSNQEPPDSRPGVLTTTLLGEVAVWKARVYHQQHFRVWWKFSNDFGKFILFCHSFGSSNCELDSVWYCLAILKISLAAEVWSNSWESKNDDKNNVASWWSNKDSIIKLSFDNRGMCFGKVWVMPTSSSSWKPCRSCCLAESPSFYPEFGPKTA